MSIRCGFLYEYYPQLGCKGLSRIREEIEKKQTGLIIRGHVQWPEPLVTLGNGTQILNVDSKVFLLFAK